jgi:autotransporter-associated beta strand protein
MKRSSQRPALALAALLVVSFGAFFADAHAATRTWTGSASNLWSAAGNWGGVAPVAGDDLVFPEGAANTTNVNDFAAGTSFASIAVSGAYSIGGNAVTLTAANALAFQSTANAGIQFTLPVTTSNAAAVIATTQADGISLDVTLGPVTIAGGSLALPVDGSVANLHFAGAIGETSTASITKTGDGVANFNANNSYSGQTIVNEGYLGVAANLALGTGTNTAADGTVVNAGGTLTLRATAQIANERVVLNGSGQSGNGAFQTQSGAGATSWGGDIVLNTTGIAMNLLGASLTISGKITGSGDFQVGRSPVTITNPLNDYAGQTVIGNPSGGSTTLVLGADGVIPMPAR